MLVTQSCPILCNTMDCSPPGSSVHGILHQDTGVGCHFLLQGIFQTQGSNPHCLCLLQWQAASLQLMPTRKLGGKNKNFFWFFSVSILPQEDCLSVKVYLRRSFFLPDFISETPSVGFYLRSSYWLSDFCLRNPYFMSDFTTGISSFCQILP